MIPGLATDARARHSDPSTSHEAACAISASLPQKQVAVLRFAARRGDQGFIDPELQANFADHSSTYRTRRAELASAGYIENTGDKRRDGAAGRRHIVWRITAMGVSEMERHR